MSKAIVYSFYSVPENPNDSPTFVMLQHSLKTLRNYNSDIPVFVYIYNVQDKTIYEEVLGNIKNLELRFRTYNPPEGLNKSYMLMMEHKWVSVFETLEEYESVLFTDCDTEFFDDPNSLFVKYNDPTKVYTLGSFLGGDFLKFFKIDKLVMNDGQFLIRDYFLKDKQTFLDARINYMLDKQKELDQMNVSSQDYYNIHSWINWAGAQYGISLLLYELDAFEEFSIEDVSLFTDLISLDDRKSLVLFHYFNYNFHNVLPDEYLDKISKERIYAAKNVEKEWAWDV